MADYAQLLGILFAARCVSSLGFLIFRKAENSYYKILEIHLGVWILASVLSALGSLEGSTLERWNQLSMPIFAFTAIKTIVPQVIIMSWDLVAFKLGFNQKWLHIIAGGFGAVILLLILIAMVTLLWFPM